MDTLLVQYQRAVDANVRSLIVAGFTGRDRAAVERHIEELRAEGIPAPERVPEFYVVPWDRLVTEGRIVVSGTRTSGEAEAVLIIGDDGTTFVAVGSDHTDRELEKRSIVESKRACPKIVSRSAWLLSEVADHWDELVLRSWVRSEGGGWNLYQCDTLASLLRPEAVIGTLRERGHQPGPGTAVFLGTVPLLEGGFVFSSGWQVELLDPVLQRGLYCRYDVVVEGREDARA